MYLFLSYNNSTVNTLLYDRSCQANFVCTAYINHGLPGLCTTIPCSLYIAINERSSINAVIENDAEDN